MGTEEEERKSSNPSIEACPIPPLSVKGEAMTSKEELGRKAETDSTTGGDRKMKWWEFITLGVIAPFLGYLYLIVRGPFQIYIRLLVGILGMVFFGVVGMVNIVHAHQKKEKIYHLRIVLSFLMCFASISIILEQFFLILIFIVPTFAISGLIYYSKRFEKLKEKMLSK